MGDKPIDLTAVRSDKAEAALAKLKAQLEATKAQLPVLKEFIQVEAEIRKQKFDAYRRVGFTEAQALEMCKGALTK